MNFFDRIGISIELALIGGIMFVVAIVVLILYLNSVVNSTV